MKQKLQLKPRNPNKLLQRQTELKLNCKTDSPQRRMSEKANL